MKMKAALAAIQQGSKQLSKRVTAGVARRQADAASQSIRLSKMESSVDALMDTVRSMADASAAQALSDLMNRVLVSGCMFLKYPESSSTSGAHPRYFWLSASLDTLYWSTSGKGGNPELDKSVRSMPTEKFRRIEAGRPGDAKPKPGAPPCTAFTIHSTDQSRRVLVLEDVDKTPPPLGVKPKGGDSALWLACLNATLKGFPATAADLQMLRNR